MYIVKDGKVINLERCVHFTKEDSLRPYIRFVFQGKVDELEIYFDSKKDLDYAFTSIIECLKEGELVCDFDECDYD